MNWIEILLGILLIVFSLIASFVFIAQTVSFEFAIGIFLICALIGFATIIDALRRE